MAKTIKFAGTIQAIESVGAVIELNRAFSYTEELDDAVWNYYDVPAGATDHPIDFAGKVDVVKMIYIKPAAAIQAKIDGTAGAAFNLTANVSIFYGPLTSMYVTTGADPVKIDVIVFG